MQQQNSHYNVFDWELERKATVKRVKNICLYPPTLTKKKSTRRGRKHSRKVADAETGYNSAFNEPNKQLFEIY